MKENQSIHFRQTTASQRRLLFEMWQETGNVAESCRRAHVSRNTFYYWKKRFDEGGYPALQEEQPRGPKNPTRTDQTYEVLVIELRHANPGWGKLQIANMVKQLHPESTISPKTVRRILRDAGLWEGQS